MTRLLLISIVLFSVACGTNRKPDTGTIDVDLAPFVLLDSTAAALALVTDHTDMFFEDVRKVEIEIQMKKNFDEDASRNDMLAEYIAFMQTQAMNFSEEESQQVTDAMNEAKRRCDAVNPSIFPMGIKMVKIRTDHYGPSVYYTRENCIMVPEDVLQNFNEEGFLNVMLHEIFHIYSRFNPEKRKELYSHIGFYPIENVEISPDWRDLILLNPDGVSYNWAIDLDLGETTAVVPLISANERTFNPEKTAFFGYLSFNLHRLIALEGEEGYVIGEPVGPQAFPTYFGRISDNTQYIIHPDEIMADNFMFLISAEGQGIAESSFSDQGKELQMRILETLKK